jgi:hypothetical protein
LAGWGSRSRGRGGKRKGSRRGLGGGAGRGGTLAWRVGLYHGGGSRRAFSWFGFPSRIETEQNANFLGTYARGGAFLRM